MKKYFSALLALFFAMPFSMTAFAAEQQEGRRFDYDINIKVSATEGKVGSGSTVIYRNGTDEAMYIEGEDHGFRNARLFVFDKNGRLIEAGESLVERSAGGAPQFGVNIPAGGFLAASNNVSALNDLYTYAMQGAMLYNATMSIIREAYGFFDEGNMTLNIKYDSPKKPAENAVKYLFVGNSTTYFNGTPVKFMGLCQAAGLDVDVQYCTFGSALLSEFADESHERGIALRNKLASQKYDYVIFHDAASAGYTDMQESASVILQLIKENGAKPVLYMRYGEGIEGQERMHSNYTKLANRLDTECSPAADAYRICIEEHPEIRLWADDNAHHSKEGSYLVACVWLYTLTGENPIGNEYDAQLDPDTAKILQEIAYKAASQYDRTEETEKIPSEKIEGIEYPLVSYEKSYTVSGKVYTGKWTDADENGNPKGKLTDGAFATNGNDTAIGCWSGSKQETVIDLGESYRIKEFFTDLYGNDSWGIGDPENATVTVYISNDGKEFTEVNTLAMVNGVSGNGWTGKNFKLVLENTLEARYVKFAFSIEGNFCWTSELAVYGLSNESKPESEISLPEDAADKTDTKNKTWIYILAAVTAALAVAAAIVFLTKRLK